MRFQPIVLMTLPPGDDAYTDDEYTRPASPGMPDTNSLTRPMQSPYVGVPSAPPPPITGPAPLWRPDGTPRMVPSAATSRPTGLLVVAGLLAAVAILAFGGVAFALVQHSNDTSPGNTTVAHAAATNTPPPTKAPTATPTQATTATAEGTGQIPLPPDGFMQYIESPGGLWGLDIPNNTNAAPGNASPDNLYQQETVFAIQAGSEFDVFDLAQPVHSGQFHAFWQQLLQEAGVPDTVSLTAAGSQEYNGMSWQVWQTQSTFGQMGQLKLLYHKHGSQATAIIITTTGGDGIDGDTQQTIDDMLNSFTYLS
jgi:hypothetical protein